MATRVPLIRNGTTGLVNEVSSSDELGPITDPTSAQNVATKAYVDAHSGTPAGTTVSTTNDSYTAGQVRNYSLTMAKSFLSWQVTEATGKAFWLRLYATSAFRTADATRPFSVPIQLGTQSGLILSLYIDQVNALTPFVLTPPIIGSNADGTQATTIYASVQSLESTTQNIQVTISYVQLES